MIDNFAGCSCFGFHLCSLKMCCASVQALLTFRVSTEKSELGPLRRWSSQGVKMWCEEGCYRTNNTSEETAKEDRKDGQNRYLYSSPVWPLGVSGRKSFCAPTADTKRKLDRRAERVTGKDLRGPWVCTKR